MKVFLRTFELAKLKEFCAKSPLQSAKEHGEIRAFVIEKRDMRFCAHALFLPTFLFIVSQIVSICGAFETLAAFDADGINDMSLEDIVFIDPFLGSHCETKAVIAIRADASGCLVSLVKIPLALLLSPPLRSLHERPPRIAYREPPGNLWLSNRVLRI